MTSRAMPAGHQLQAYCNRAASLIMEASMGFDDQGCGDFNAGSGFDRRSGVPLQDRPHAAAGAVSVNLISADNRLG